MRFLSSAKPSESEGARHRLALRLVKNTRAESASFYERARHTHLIAHVLTGEHDRHDSAGFLITLPQFLEQHGFAATWRSLHHVSVWQAPSFFAGEAQLPFDGIEDLCSSNKMERDAAVSPIQEDFECLFVVFAEYFFHSLDSSNSQHIRFYLQCEAPETSQV